MDDRRKSNGTPRVTVVIPTYRRPQLLVRAVESVRAQTFADWELVITDDETPSGETWRYLQELARMDPRIKVFQNPGPHGQVGNVNFAFRNARAEWVKPLFDDDVLVPGCLETMLRAADRDPGAALIGCLATFYKKGGRVIQLPATQQQVRLKSLTGKQALLAMYLNDLDIGTPSQMLVNRKCLDHGVLFEDVPELVSNVDTWWFARLMREGSLTLMNARLVEQHQGEWTTVTSNISATALDGEFRHLKRLFLTLVDPGLNPPPLQVAQNSVDIIRGIHYLTRGKIADSWRILAGIHDWRAWNLGVRWFIRRATSDRIRIVPYTNL